MKFSVPWIIDKMAMRLFLFLKNGANIKNIWIVDRPAIILVGQGVTRDEDFKIWNCNWIMTFVVWISRGWRAKGKHVPYLLELFHIVNCFGGEQMKVMT